MNGADYANAFADLACVVESLPKLPEPVRAGFLAMVRAVAGSTG